MDENYLILEARKGDMDAFNSLVLAYQSRVYNLAYRILGDEAAAEDVTQTTFLVAFQKFSGFRGGSYLAWVLRIATNQCYDSLRYTKRHPTTPLDPNDDDEDVPETPSWMTDHSNQPEAMFDQSELDHAIQHCLSALPAEYRTVAVLVDVQGMDYEEASEIIKSPLGTIKSRLARARLRLRECLSGVWELLPSAIRLNIEGNQ